MAEKVYTERLRNIPTGNDGNGYAVIDGKLLSVLKVAKMQGKFTGTVESKRFLEERMTQHALRGGEGTGSLSYYPTTYFAKLIEIWKDTGVCPSINLQYYNQVNGAHGRGEYLLRDVILKDIEFGNIDDSSSEAIMHTTDITFDDFSIISEMV